MNESLKQRLLSISPYAPYVWQLKINEQEYNELAQWVNNVPQRINKEYAVLAIVYIAEWYKRDYDGTVINPLRVPAESLWEASGFDIETYVYKTVKTTRYLESIFMLGGLPMKFLTQRSDKKLLKALCRIYKGDKSSLDDDNIGKGQSLAFQESIKQESSLYHFMKSLLLDNEHQVYADADLADKSSMANRFIKAIKDAYEDVMRDKFRLEWIVAYCATSPYMKRMLRVWLRPEELDGLHQYLRFERAGTWKIPNLMRQRQLVVNLQFKNGNEIVGDENTRKPIIWFENSGQEDTGFEATGTSHCSVLKSLPTQPFDRINVIVTDDSGNQYEVQHFDCKAQYMQLWLTQNGVNLWSSIRNNQSETAVVFTDYYKLSGAETIVKRFYDKSNGISEPWNFAFITDKVTLSHEGIPDITLWNRYGYIQFMPKLYTNVLRYNSGKVKFVHEELDIEEWYPIIFRKNDIKVFHFSTREKIETDAEEMDIQQIEYKPYSAPASQPYEVWANEIKPQYGRLKLRFTIKDEQKVYTVLYLPSMLDYGKDVPVVRNFEESSIQYVDRFGNIVSESVNIPLDKRPLEISYPVIIGDEQVYVQLDVIQPTKIKEIYLDGSITKYINDGEEFLLPFLLRDRVVIHDFNSNGYLEYECFNVGVLDEEKGSVQKWKNGVSLKTRDIAVAIPDYIRLAYGLRKNNGSINKMLYWEYNTTEPITVDANYDMLADSCILFHDMRKINDNLDCVPPINNDGWNINESDWDDWGNTSDADKSKSDDASLLMCYDVATKYKTYYFIFTPLYNLDKDQFLAEICEPLKSRRGGELTEEDMQNLMRCATECGLDWNELYRKI